MDEREVVKSVILTIDQAFQDMPRPAEGEILYDAVSGDEEALVSAKGLSSTHWRNVSFGTLEQSDSVLFYMTPAAFRFYLPAFMVFSLTDFERADTIPYKVVHILTPPHPQDVDRAYDAVEPVKHLANLDEVEWRDVRSLMHKAHEGDGAARLFLERVSGFGDEQGVAIRGFLECMGSVFAANFPLREPQMAIDRYWHRFPPA